MNKYKQDDSLKDMIDWSAVMPLPRFAGGHDEQMRALITGAKVVSHWNEGGYSGRVATLVELTDGRAALYCDYYGSCSGCDAWEGASDEDVRKLCIDLANGAYVFESIIDAADWLKGVVVGDITPDGYQWDAPAASGLLAGWRQA